MSVICTETFTMSISVSEILKQLGCTCLTQGLLRGCSQQVSQNHSLIWKLDWGAWLQSLTKDSVACGNWTIDSIFISYWLVCREQQGQDGTGQTPRQHVWKTEPFPQFLTIPQSQDVSLCNLYDCALPLTAIQWPITFLTQGFALHGFRYIAIPGSSILEV